MLRCVSCLSRFFETSTAWYRVIHARRVIRGWSVTWSHPAVASHASWRYRHFHDYLYLFVFISFSVLVFLLNNIYRNNVGAIHRNGNSERCGLPRHQNARIVGSSCWFGASHRSLTINIVCTTSLRIQCRHICATEPDLEAMRQISNSACHKYLFIVDDRKIRWMNGTSLGFLSVP